MLSGLSGTSDNFFWSLLAGAAAALLAVFMLKALFFVERGKSSSDIEISAAEQPLLFDFLNRLADEVHAPRAHRVYVSGRVNAAVFYDLSIANLLIPSRKNLEIGLGLVNVLSLGELKAVLAHEFGHFAQRSRRWGAGYMWLSRSQATVPFQDSTLLPTGEEPTWVSGITTAGDPARFSEVEESVLWQARFPGGAVAHCGASFNSSPVGYMRAVADRGWFALEPAFDYDGIRGSRSDGKPLEFPPINQFAAEMDDFARCIVEKTPSRVSGEEGLREVRILTAIYESARSGRPVEQ